ncbi:MAG TPA: hypothetical protein VGP93_17180, partial [Polyangiaceae bacterium]|nr:hypothetical protein [Polyangiaceae bacterium]
GWPTFTPDGESVIFHAGSSAEFEAAEPNTGELYRVDVASRQVSRLDAANGRSGGAAYLAQEELNLNFVPTVLPVAVGGYYWVMFTSRRAYGNSVAPGAPGELGAGRFAKASPRKKIWVAAIDLDYSGKVDPSHPAFYLDGQELAAGNLRPFAALEPCREQGASCESGADCCERFCREVDRDAQGTPILQCVPPPESGCSNLDEACGAAADCCNSAQLCIGGRCALPAPEPPPPR